MTPLDLHALVLLLLCLHPPHSAAAAAADPTPTPWPHQFNAALLTGYGDRLSSLVNLWYDWPGGRMLHDIRSPDEPSYVAQWNNGTTFFYTPAGRACRRSVKAGVGIPRPDWFAPGAAYLGRARVNLWYDCHVWAKAGFVTYYEDAETRQPVKWVFHTGRVAHVMSFDPGSLVEHAEWQAPDYCFAEETLISEPDGHDDGSFIPKNAESLIGLSRRAES